MLREKTYFLQPEFNRWVLRLALPGMLQGILSVSVNAINNLLTGRYFGSVEMSAIGQTASIFAIFEVITYGFSASCGVLVAQYWGKKDMNKIHHVISVSTRLECLLGLLFALIMFFIPDSVMHFMSKDPEVIALGAQYLRITSPVYFFYGMTNALYSTFTSLEMVRVAFFGRMLCSIINLSLCWILVPTYGVAGAGFAALISRGIDFLYVLVVLFVSKRLAYQPKELLQRDSALFGDFLHVAYPIMGHEIIWSVGNNMPQILMGRIGTSATSAFSIALTLSSLLSIVQSGLGNACLSITGKTIGEGDEHRVRKTANTFLVYTIIEAIVSSLAMFLLRPAFLSFYDLPADVLEMADKIMMVLAVNCLFTGFDAIILVSLLRAAGMGKVGFYTDIVVMWMIAIPLAWLGLLKWSLAPHWIVALVKIDMPLKTIVALYTVYKTNWIHNLTREEIPAETTTD